DMRVSVVRVCRPEVGRRWAAQLDANGKASDRRRLCLIKTINVIARFKEFLKRDFLIDIVLTWQEESILETIQCLESWCRRTAFKWGCHLERLGLEIATNLRGQFDLGVLVNHIHRPVAERFVF